MDAHDAQSARAHSADPKDIHRRADAALSGSGSAFPHARRIQQSFGHHGIQHFRAHLDTKAQALTKASRAKGMTKGTRSAFANPSPSLHTAAHEAAHAKVFELSHVRLPGNVGAVGDPHEQLADSIADRVVRGHSAADLLDAIATGPTARSGAAATAQHPVQFQPDDEISQFNPRDLGSEYADASARHRLGLAAGGWAQGLVRGGQQGYRAGHSAAGGGIRGRLLGGLGALGGGLVGTVSGLGQGVGGALYDTGRGAGYLARGLGHQMDKNPLRTTAVLGTAGSIGMNAGLATTHAASMAFQGANASVGSILGGASNAVRSGLEGYRWYTQGRHIQSGWGTGRSVARGVHNLAKITTSAVHAGKWIDKARGATMQGGQGASWFNPNIHAGTTAGSQSLAALGNAAAVTGIVSGSFDMVRGGLGAWNHHQRNRHLRQKLAEKNITTSAREQDALNHVQKHNNKQKWANIRRGLGGALVTGGSVMTATGIGAPAGSLMVMAGLAAQSMPKAWQSVKQMRRNQAEARRTMTHEAWLAQHNEKIAKNKRRAEGAPATVRLAYWMKRKGLEYQKWWNRSGWKAPTMGADGKPQSYADWKANKEADVDRHSAPESQRGLLGGIKTAFRHSFGSGGTYHRNKYRGTSRLGKVASGIGNLFYGAGLGLSALFGGAARGLGRSVAHGVRRARAGLWTQANWDKSDQKLKAKHLSHAQAFFGEDGKETAAGAHALDALGLGYGKYKGGMTGRDLLAKSAGHESWTEVPAEDKAKLVARVMRKGGVQEAAIGIREKRESDAYAHKRMMTRVADLGAPARHLSHQEAFASLAADASGANLTQAERNADSQALHEVPKLDALRPNADPRAVHPKKVEFKRDYRSVLAALHEDPATHKDAVREGLNPSAHT